MKMTLFRVTNFRNINDSDWIPVESVTAFVGRNESGKTTLLKALHKFNPATPEPPNPQRDFPRDRYTAEFSDPSKWWFCAAHFEIADALQDEIASLLGAESPKAVTCTRWYNGGLTMNFVPALVEQPIAPKDVLDGLAAFASAARRLPSRDGEEETAASARRGALALWATNWQDRLKGVADLRTSSADLNALKAEAEAHSSPDTADAVEALMGGVSPALQSAQRDPVLPQVKALVQSRLPVFVYFENFGILDSAIYLPRFLEDQQAKPNDPRLRTISAMFQHVNLSAADIAGLAREEAQDEIRSSGKASPAALERDRQRKDERAIKLSSASLDITRKFSEWWHQRRHLIRYDADGDYFRIWVSDDRRPGVEIELEERSKGFQWFFSFYLVFLVEADEGHKDAIILLDEPGLHLHPTAQQELIGFFEKLSEKNQLLYSTHSPFLIDGDNLHRIRPVVEDASGHSRITVGEWPSDRDTIFPLQAAAGYAMVRGLFLHKDNLLVEGMTDYYLVNLLAEQCRAKGRESLSDSIYITPCGGTKLVGNLASLFLGQEVRPVVLLDGDQAGSARRDALMKELYAGHAGHIVMVDAVLNTENAEIEDILGEDVFVAAANAALGLKLKLTAEDRKVATAVGRIEAAAARQKIDLPNGWKPQAALQLVRRWAEAAEELPEEVLDRAGPLISEINLAFQRG